ncbi:MAG: ATP-binding protein [Thermoguttaceae bacterium]|nr:ATP-binding protein [Thermoguttaceae bacterium]
MQEFVDDVAGLLEMVGPEDTSVEVPPALPAESCLVFVADLQGRLLCLGEGQSEAPGELAAAARDAAGRLRDAKACRFVLGDNGSAFAAVAIRLSDPSAERVVGCLFPSDVSPSPQVDECEVVAAALAAAWDRARAENRLLATRVQHLLAEREMLGASQSQALAVALEERDRRLHEQETHLSEIKRLHLETEMVLNTAGEGILGLGEDGRITFVNPAAAALLGYGVKDLLGKECHDTIHPTLADGSPCRKGTCPVFDALDAPGMSAVEGQFFRRKDGRSFPVEFTSRQIRDGEKVLGRVITFRDITERRKLETQLRRAQKLNTPTQFIGDNTRFLQEAFGEIVPVLEACRTLDAAQGDNLPSAQLLDAIRASAAQADIDYLVEEIPKAIAQSLEGVERVTTIVRSMKEFSHPDTERQQAVDLNRAIESTITVARNEWKYVADLETDFDPELPPVTCHPGDINQVILNLIINAAHAIGDKVRDRHGQKGKITISTRRDGDWVEVRVADTGTGIPEEIRSRVFDPFFTTKPVGRGTGQGLAIAHAVVIERHRGTIHFDSKVGEGTTFVIRLPLQSNPEHAPGEGLR